MGQLARTFKGILASSRRIYCDCAAQITSLKLLQLTLYAQVSHDWHSITHTLSLSTLCGRASKASTLSAPESITKAAWSQTSDLFCGGA